MLDNLLEIEVAYSMLKGGDAGEDPIDAHYKKLKTEMEVCKNHSKITKLLKYVLNFTTCITCAITSEKDIQK